MRGIPIGRNSMGGNPCWEKFYGMNSMLGEVLWDEFNVGRISIGGIPYLNDESRVRRSSFWRKLAR